MLLEKQIAQMIIDEGVKRNTGGDLVRDVYNVLKGVQDFVTQYVIDIRILENAQKIHNKKTIFPD